MRKENILLTERNLMYVVGGQLFDQAPNRQPRKTDIIMNTLRDNFRKLAVNDNEWYYIKIDIADKGLYKFIDKILKEIPEFNELNLNQIEFEKGISVDDESRAKYSFCSSYDLHTSESWKTDFIDLDAFVQNVVYNLSVLIDDKDCTCCVNTDKDNQCGGCKHNKKFVNNYKGSREPRDKYTFACKFDCYRSYYICCEECPNKDECEHLCDAKSVSCGLAINHKVVK
jgi:hypothetical protein